MPSGTEVIFLLSVPGTLKQRLLKSAKLLVYTPSNEHFGIVPLEAMLSGVPVLAADTGGPTETVVEGVTGWLRDPEQVDEWTRVMHRVLNQMSKEELAEMSSAGVARVRDRFAVTQMAEQLDQIFKKIENPHRRGNLMGTVITLVTAVFVSMGAIIVAFLAIMFFFMKGSKV